LNWCRSNILSANISLRRYPVLLLHLLVPPSSKCCALLSWYAASLVSVPGEISTVAVLDLTTGKDSWQVPMSPTRSHAYAGARFLSRYGARVKVRLEVRRYCGMLTAGSGWHVTSGGPVSKLVTASFNDRAKAKGLGLWEWSAVRSILRSQPQYPRFRVGSYEPLLP